MGECYLTPRNWRMIFRANRDIPRDNGEIIKKGTLLMITIAGEYGGRAREYNPDGTLGKHLGGGIIYGWLDHVAETFQ